MRQTDYPAWFARNVDPPFSFEASRMTLTDLLQQIEDEFHGLTATEADDLEQRLLAQIDATRKERSIRVTSPLATVSEIRNT